MAGRLPVLSGRDVVRVLQQFEWAMVRQSDSHMIMVKDGKDVTLSVPDHRKVAKGTMRSLIRSAGLTVDDFVDKA